MASGVAWVVLIAIVVTVFFTVLIPGVQFGGRGEIPADFPVYPGAALQSALATTAGGCTTVDATWSTGDDVSRVVAFYQERLGGGDWMVTDTTPSGQGTLIRFQSTSGAPREGDVQIDASPFSKSTQLVLNLVKSGTNASCHLVVGTRGS